MAVAAAKAGQAAISLAGDLQQATANISTIKPEIDTSQVFQALNEMQTRVPQTAAQLGDALYDVFSSVNVTQEEGLRLVEEFAKGAVGAATDAKTFGTAALGVMNAYGLAVEDASHISDVFFNTVNKGVVTGQELAANLGIVTQGAKLAGVSIDELGGFIAGVTKEGGPAAQNINNLSNLFNKITTKEAQKELHALGVATTDAQGQFLPLTQVMTDLKASMAGMSEAAQTLALQKIFPDLQAKQGAQVILDQLDFVKEAIAENIASVGAAGDAYSKMSATFNSQSQLLKNTFSEILTTVGGELLPSITPLVTAFRTQLPEAFADTRRALAPIGAFFDDIRMRSDALGEVHGIKGFDASLQALSQRIEDSFGPNTARLFDQFTQLLSDMSGEAERQFERINLGFGELPGKIEQIASGQLAQITDDVGKDLQSIFEDWVAPALTNLVDEKLPALGTGIATWINEQSGPMSEETGKWAFAFSNWVIETALPQTLGALEHYAEGIIHWAATDGQTAMRTAGWNVASGYYGGIYKGLADGAVGIKDAFEAQIRETQEFQRRISLSSAELRAENAQNAALRAAAAAGLEDQRAGERNPTFMSGSVEVTQSQAAENVRIANEATRQYQISIGLLKEERENLAEELDTPVIPVQAGRSGSNNRPTPGPGVIPPPDPEKTRKQAETAVAAFMRGLQDATANNAVALGVGANLASQVSKGVTDGLASSAESSRVAMEKLIVQLHDAGVPNWRELGNELAGVVMIALRDRTEEAKGRAVDFIGSIVGIFNQAKFDQSVAKALDDLVTEFDSSTRKDKVGRSANELMAAFTASVKARAAGLQEDVDKAVAATGKLGADVLRNLREALPPQEAAEWGAAFIDAWNQAQADGTEQGLINFKEFLDGMRYRVTQFTHEDLGSALAESIGDAISAPRAKEKLARAGYELMNATRDAIADETPQTVAAMGRAFDKVAEEARTSLSPERAAEVLNTYGAMVRQAFDAKSPELEAAAREYWNGVVAGADPDIGAAAAARITNSVRDEIAKSKDSFQQLGTMLGQDFAAYLVNPVKETEKDLDQDLRSVVSGLAKSQIPGWQQMAAEIGAAWAQAMKDKSPESAAAAEALVNAALGRVQAADFSGAIRKANEDLSKALGRVDIVGGFRATMQDAFTSIDEVIQNGSAKSIGEIGKFGASAINAIRTNLPPEQAKALIGQFMDALDAFFATRTPESAAKLKASWDQLTAPLQASITTQTRTMMESITALFNEAKWAEKVGSGSLSLMKAVQKAITDGTPAAQSAAAKAATDVLLGWQKGMSPVKFAQVKTEFITLMEAVANGGGKAAVDALGAYVSQFDANGRNLTGAAAAGVRASMPDFAAANVEFANAGITAFKDTVDIHSLSGVYMDFGENEGDATTTGLLNKKGDYQKGVKEFAEAGIEQLDESIPGWRTVLDTKTGIAAGAGLDLASQAKQRARNEQEHAQEMERLQREQAAQDARFYADLKANRDQANADNAKANAEREQQERDHTAALAAARSAALASGAYVSPQSQAGTTTPYGSTIPTGGVNSNLGGGSNTPVGTVQGNSVWNGIAWVPMSGSGNGLYGTNNTAPSNSSGSTETAPAVPTNPYYSTNGNVQFDVTTGLWTVVGLSAVFPDHGTAEAASRVAFPAYWTGTGTANTSATTGTNQYPPGFVPPSGGVNAPYAIGNGPLGIRPDQEGAQAAIIARIIADVKTMTDPLTQLPADLTIFIGQFSGALQGPLTQFATQFATQNAPFLAALHEFGQGSLGFQNNLINLERALSTSPQAYQAALAGLPQDMQGVVGGLTTWLQNILPTVADPAQQLPGLIRDVLAGFPPDMAQILTPFLLQLAGVLDGGAQAYTAAITANTPGQLGQFAQIIAQAIIPNNAAGWQSTLAGIPQDLRQSLDPITTWLRGLDPQAQLDQGRNIQNAIAAFSQTGDINSQQVQQILGLLPANIAQALMTILPQMFATLNPIAQLTAAEPGALGQFASIIAQAVMPNNAAGWQATIANLPRDFRTLTDPITNWVRGLNPDEQVTANQNLQAAITAFAADGDINSSRVQAALGQLPSDIAAALASILPQLFASLGPASPSLPGGLANLSSLFGTAASGGSGSLAFQQQLAQFGQQDRGFLNTVIGAITANPGVSTIINQAIQAFSQHPNNSDPAVAALLSQLPANVAAALRHLFNEQLPTVNGSSTAVSGATLPVSGIPTNIAQLQAFFTQNQGSGGASILTELQRLPQWKDEVLGILQQFVQVGSLSDVQLQILLQALPSNLRNWLTEFLPNLTQLPTNTTQVPVTNSDGTPVTVGADAITLALQSIDEKLGPTTPYLADIATSVAELASGSSGGSTVGNSPGTDNLLATYLPVLTTQTLSHRVAFDAFTTSYNAVGFPSLMAIRDSLMSSNGPYLAQIAASLDAVLTAGGASGAASIASMPGWSELVQAAKDTSSFLFQAGYGQALATSSYFPPVYQALLQIQSNTAQMISALNGQNAAGGGGQPIYTNVPHAASGHVAWKPTMLLVGEGSVPEITAPIDMLKHVGRQEGWTGGGGSGEVHYHYNTIQIMGDTMFDQKIVDKLRRAGVQFEQRNGRQLFS